MYLELYIYFTDNNVILFTLDDPDYNILHYYQMITLQCDHNLFDEFLYNFN